MPKRGENIPIARSTLNPEDYKPELGSSSTAANHSASEPMIAKSLLLNVIENEKYLIFLRALQVSCNFQTSQAVLLLNQAMFKTFPMAPSALYCFSKFPPRQISVQWNEPKKLKAATNTHHSTLLKPPDHLFLHPVDSMQAS
ncbi:hypothetical protein CAEBREN_23776 [Caenorhabditis brenneri]|uniref:Uncharacterized protein n=1 Tax=Caenorhabditis brenneri TaxID=135651 RepID=G0NDY7_CAEBE|nr:hypothetical protein CAEBREN_23776 [Caenorhabditis brenneri]